MKKARMSAVVGLMIAALSLTTVNEVSRIDTYAATVTAEFSGMTLSKDGSASWNLVSVPGQQEVDKYELRLARKSSGNWNTSYKTVKTSDNSYEFSFSATGQYYYTVRAIFIGGDVSGWSAASPTVSVGSEDIVSDTGSTGGSGTAYVQVVGTDGRIYYVPAGPGTGYTSTTSTIGPGGTYISGGSSGTIYYSSNTSVINAVNGSTSGAISGSAVTGGNASSGWIKDGTRWRYRYANNTYARGSMDRIDNEWYYFDNNGFMTTGWVYYNSNWYLFGVDGKMRTGWNMVNNKWYYMNGGGIMQTGYVTVDGITYYCDQSGARVQGGYNPDGHYFDESGVMIK